MVDCLENEMRGFVLWKYDDYNASFLSSQSNKPLSICSFTDWWSWVLTCNSCSIQMLSLFLRYKLRKKNISSSLTHKQKHLKLYTFRLSFTPFLSTSKQWIFPRDKIKYYVKLPQCKHICTSEIKDWTRYTLLLNPHLKPRERTGSEAINELLDDVFMAID
jgi:predicted Zn-ribbon and HTH transcriptional regulator